MRNNKSPALFLRFGATTLVAFMMWGCAAPEPDDPFFNQLAEIMKRNEPQIIKDATADVSAEICPIVSEEKLQELARHPDLRKSMDFAEMPNGGPFEPPGTKKWTIRRGIQKFIVQSLVINLEPNTDFCRADIYNRSW